MTDIEYRTGVGFDVHAFDLDHPAWRRDETYIRLFGVDVPHYKKLSGHSDADVGLHALCDAIYGICADGDIGTHFPPSDDANKDKDSTLFLAHALKMLHAKGGQLTHIDLILMGEEPKMKPFRRQIVETLSHLTQLDLHQIGFKATTTEKLGFTGRREGLASQAIATAKFKNGFIV